jgi:3-hydroxyacyl-[acyl-carrier-protein] dehydratase
MPPASFVDISKIDCSKVVADVPEIQKLNPHRHHMLHLDAIVELNFEEMLIVGYKDVRHDEFWVSGHMPGYPLLPGVIMCEAAAQMISYYTKKLSIFGDDLLGLGGLDEARFRAPVRPGDRLIMVGKGVKVSRRITIFNVQGYVGNTMVFEARITGVPIPGGEKIANAIAEAQAAAEGSPA